MAHRLATPEGKKPYALRKQTPGPVFRIVKSVLGFRQFSLRGLDKVRGEWKLVTLAWNIKRMFALKPAAKPPVAPSCAMQELPTAAWIMPTHPSPGSTASQSASAEQSLPRFDR